MTDPSYSQPKVAFRRSRRGLGMAARISCVVVAVGAVVLAREASPRPHFGPQTGFAAPGQPATPVAVRVTAPDTAGRAERDLAACPDGMVLVEGEYCPAVAQNCTKWIDEKRDRCAEYAPSGRCLGKVEPKRFCIDRYEYPNQIGTKPVVAVTWEEAKAQCQSMGKRLCGATEWTLACEGPERQPYPNGTRRDPKACNYDKPYIMPNDEAFLNPATRAREVERVSQSVPSGTSPDCVSAYGVYDMTGNVDEWVVNEAGTVTEAPYQSGLKGGYWGPVRDRCRPMTTDHNMWHSGYQIGFRCCGDALRAEPRPDETVPGPRVETGSS
jgi:formylglycine-generating enzyme